jgi:L-threonylcarbamoyladenylate synthase
MQTEVLRVNAEHPESEVIARAAGVLRGGGLVAFPTETVYGLGANAGDARAVTRIFAAKGRPATNPVIVHVANADQAVELVEAWPATAQQLAEHYWPGPLTLVLAKREVVPDVVTAGGATVALRVPAHPVARALIEAAAVPVAAPSANLSTRVSPTRAEHVLRGLGGHIDLVLDGGPTVGGLESTVLDMTTVPPRLLRPGLVTPAAIEAVIGPINVGGGQEQSSANKPLRSPGMHKRHYAPRAVLECVEGDGRQRAEELARRGVSVGWVTFEPQGRRVPGVMVLRLSTEPTVYAAQLYAALHSLDDAEVDWIVVDLPPRDEGWLAIHDRLRRAATDSVAQTDRSS